MIEIPLEWNNGDVKAFRDGFLTACVALMGLACEPPGSAEDSGPDGGDSSGDGDGDSGDGDSGDGDSGDGDSGDGDSGDGDSGDGDSGDGDSGDGDSGDGDSGDGDSGDGDTGDNEFPDCGVGGDTSISWSYIDFNQQEIDAEYHAVCEVASVAANGNETTVGFDCPDDYHPGVVITSEPVWNPSFVVGTSLDVHLEYLGKWSSGEWMYGTTWKLASTEDDSIVAALVDVYRWYGEAPLGMQSVADLCEPEGYCESEGQGTLPRSQNVALEFTLDDETIRLFAGNSGQLGDYDIWVDEANYDACEDQLDSAPGLYRVFVAR